MLYKIKLYLLILVTAILYANPTFADKDNRMQNNSNYIIYLRHPLDVIDRPFSFFDYYWNNIFNDRFSSYESSSIRSKIIAQDKQYIIVMEVPGYSKNQIKVKANSNKLFISGSIDDTETNSPANHLNKNFNYIISLLDDIDQKAISSNLKNGILTITLPRIQIKEENVKEIPIS
ncbi:MAG: Hsp20/alpha crystallin family protein [Rickettsia endosymbiont of Haemaphysalis japonica]